MKTNRCIAIFSIVYSCVGFLSSWNAYRKIPNTLPRQRNIRNRGNSHVFSISENSFSYGTNSSVGQQFALEVLDDKGNKVDAGRMKDATEEELFEEANRQLQASNILAMLAKLPISRLRELICKYDNKSLPDSDKDRDLDSHVLCVVSALWKHCGGDVSGIRKVVDAEVGAEVESAVNSLYEAFSSGELIPLTRVKEMLLLETSRSHKLLINRSERNIPAEEYLAALVDALRLKYENNLEAVAQHLQQEVMRAKNHIIGSPVTGTAFRRQVGFGPAPVGCGMGKHRGKGKIWDRKRWATLDVVSGNATMEHVMTRFHGSTTDNEFTLLDYRVDAVEE